MTTKQPSKRQIANGIGRYLDELDAGGANGVHLGPRRGITTDPDEIDELAGKIEIEISETTSPIKRLRLTQKALDLRAAADALRTYDGSARAFFVEHAAAYAEENGLTYAAFRGVGVPPAVLREAGISP